MNPSVDELELKARVDDPEQLQRALARAGAQVVFRGRMIDRRYDKGGELESRDEVLRLRMYQVEGGTTHGVLAWKGPVDVRGGYKHREEREVQLGPPDEMLVVLERLGYEIVLRIDREIVEYRLGAATVRIEWYPTMDTLVEVEGEPEAIERAVRATTLPRARFLPEALPYFVADYERRTGATARLARDS